MKNLIILFLLIFFLLPTSYSLFKECGNFGKCQCGDNLISNHYSSQLDFLNSCSKSHALIINTSNIELNCNGNEITSFINGTQYSGIIISANNVTITNCEIYNFHNAIEIINSSNIEIKNSLLYDNVASGIDIRNSTDIIIKNNTILNNWDGIFTLDSSSIVIENNTIQFNLIDGIHLFYGTHNSIVKNNELSNNDGHAIAPIHCSHTIEDSNFAYGKLVKYYSNDEGLNISNQEFAELILCNINNSIISNLKFNNYEMKTDGILSVNSNNNNYFNLNFENVRAGIYLYQSKNNLIENILVKHSDYGLRFMQNSSNNVAQNISFYNVENSILLNVSSSENEFNDLTILDSGIVLTDLIQNETFSEILITPDLSQIQIERYFQRDSPSLFSRFMEWVYRISLTIK